MFVVLSSPSSPLSLPVLQTPILQRVHSYLHSHLYRVPSAQCSLKPSRCKEGDYCHGQHHHCDGSDTPMLSVVYAIPLMGATLSLDLMTRPFGFGTLRLVQ